MSRYLLRYLLVLFSGASLACCTSHDSRTPEVARSPQLASSPKLKGLPPPQTEAAPQAAATLATPTPLGSSRRVLVPDTSVNGALYLEQLLPARGPFGTLPVTLTEGLRESPVAVFVNQGRQQYLLASQYEGDTGNTFAAVEIGYVFPAVLQRPHRQTNLVRFRTESGLRLGLSLRQVLALKGHDYRLGLTPDSVLTYRLDRPEQSPFLRRYAMPGYFLALTIYQAKITAIKFGFDYP